MSETDVTISLDELPEADDTVSIDEIGPVDVDHRTLDGRNFVTYTKTKFLKKKNGKVYGHWHTSFTAACAMTGFQNYIDQGAVISLINAGSCGSGDKITKCISR